MTITQMLTRFGPVYAADGEGVGPMPEMQDAPPVETPPETPPATDEVDLEVEVDGLNTPEPEAEEWEEVEFDEVGKLKVPKGMSQKAIDAMMRTADYTKKTQEVAARAKELELREQTAKVVGEIEAKFNEGAYHLKNMDTALKAEYDYFQSPQYQQDQLDDFQKADARWKQYQMNLMTRQQLAGGLQSLAHERNSKLAEAQKALEAEASKRREQLPREIAKLVPGWNAEMQASVEDFAVRTLGYEPEALKSSTEPKHFQTLHLAMIGQKYLSALARKGKGAVVPKPSNPTKPVGQRGGGADSGPKDTDDIATWMAKERQRDAAKLKAARA
jgi:hypothetical protein